MISILELIGARNFHLQLDSVMLLVIKYFFIDLISGGGIGFMRGLYFGVPRNLELPPRLLINNLVNSVGKESSRLGNAAGAASYSNSFVK